LPHGEIDSLLELVTLPLFGGKIQWLTLLPNGELDWLLEFIAFLMFGGKI